MGQAQDARISDISLYIFTFPMCFSLQNLKANMHLTPYTTKRLQTIFLTVKRVYIY